MEPMEIFETFYKGKSFVYTYISIYQNREKSHLDDLHISNYLVHQLLDDVIKVKLWAGVSYISVGHLGEGEHRSGHPEVTMQCLYQSLLVRFVK